MCKKYVIPSTENVKFQEFVDFWSKLYDITRDSKYFDNIIKYPKTIENMNNLYVWKNRRRKLGGTKKVSFDNNIKPNLKLINELHKNFDIDEFKKTFKNMGLIYRIFLLHIIKPEVYPILDRNVILSYQYIHEQPELRMTNSEKERFYLTSYVNFFNSTVNSGDLKRRKVFDYALWNFGRFLQCFYMAKQQNPNKPKEQDVLPI